MHGGVQGRGRLQLLLSTGTAMVDSGDTRAVEGWKLRIDTYPRLAKVD